MATGPPPLYYKSLSKDSKNMGHMVSFRGEKAFHFGVHLENSYWLHFCGLAYLFPMTPLSLDTYGK